MASKRTSRPKSGRRTKKRLQRTAYERWRRRLAWCALASVAAAGLYLYLYVTVSRRFDGRLWRLPSRIYADAVSLRAGDPASGESLRLRLSRTGFAEVESVPRRPGQYRVLADRVELHTRPFSAPGLSIDSERVSVGLRNGIVRDVRSADGRRRRVVTLEPELLATVYEARQEERVPLALEDVPEGFVAAVLAAEDIRFYRHHGIDPRGVMRAAATNLRRGRIVQGGSTITQQTVKNLFLGQERTWWRKAREGLMSVVLDAHYSKDRILEVYVNEVYLGQRRSVAICGAQAAALFYFGRGLADLSHAEWATLAGMISSPGLHNPHLHPERALARRDQVLDAMLSTGAIDEETHATAKGEALALASGSAGFTDAPYAVDYVRSRLPALIDRKHLAGAGLRIFTTIDTTHQESAAGALATGLQRLDKRPEATPESPLEGAIVVTRPESGAVLALVGGRDYRRSQFNRAVQARRQPGSCFKPFVFAAGFELTRERDPNGLDPWTVLDDEPVRMRVAGKIWEPANYDRRYRGPVTARQALEQSLNVPTVRAAARIGIPRVVETARRCGIDSEMAPVPSLALGTSEVTPLELAEAYGTLAHGGIHTEPWVVRAVVDSDGEVLYRHEPASERVLSAETAYQLRDMLEGVFQRGTARSARSLGYRGRAAGKTGTTDDTRDAWFVGYTEGLLSLVWIGSDDNARTGLTGASGALPVWVDLMNRSTHPASRRVPIPDDIVVVRIDPETGLLAVRGCPRSVRERFVRGTEPRDECRQHLGRFRRWWRRLRDRDADGPVI